MSRADAQAKRKAAQLRGRNPAFAPWAKGYGVIRHGAVTQVRIAEMQTTLAQQKSQGDGVPLFDLLYALDRVASAGMWLVVHGTYARKVHLDGRPLEQDDFKPRPWSA